MSETLLAVEDLHVHFDTYAGRVHAVNGMSLAVGRGEFFGLVGESGCGKSVTGLAIVRMVPGGGRIASGRIVFHGEDLLAKSGAEMRQVRGRRIAMIFQDPAASLNPVFTVGSQIGRVIRQHTSASRAEAGRRAHALLEAVALPDPPRILRSYPHELSGGMQQRIMIAMALSCGAELLIADEPTTALDVTIQAQILALLADIRARQGISILLITHNLGVVAETCDRVAVAYAGQVVEVGAKEDVLFHALHPYTQGLLAALPRPGGQGEELRSIPGSVPDGLQLLTGCPFHPRCTAAGPGCATEVPPLVAANGGGHLVACHLYRHGGQA